MMHVPPLLAAAQSLKAEAKSISPKMAFVATGLTLTILGFMAFKEMKHTMQEMMRELDRHKPHAEPEADEGHSQKHRRHESHRR